MERWRKKETNKEQKEKTLAFALLPNLHARHNHLPVLIPRGMPLIARVPEIQLGRLRQINPWLTRAAVLEPSVGAAHGDAEDEIELLIKRRRIVARAAPRVGQAGAVAVRERELPSLPERLVEIGVEHLQQPGVDVGEEILFAPFQPEGVHLLRKGRVQRVPLDVGPPPGIVGRVWPPVQRAGDDVVPTLLVRVVVPTRFDDVNLTRLGPDAISILHRQKPDGRP